jgi:O-antigen/teichoic acid export membrane protein
MLTQRAVKGASWLLVGRLISNGIGLVSTIVVARLLLPSDFGVVALGLSVLAIVSSLVELPTGTALIQLQDVRDDDFDTAWTLGILKGVAVCVAMIVAAWPVAVALKDQRLVGLMIMLSFYPLVLGVRNAYFENFARDMQFSREVILDVSSKVASFVGTVAFAYYFRTYWALPLGQILSGVVASAMSFILIPKRPKFSLKSFNRIFKFSVWLGASSMVLQLNWQADSLIVGRLLGATSVGFLSVGGQVTTRINEVTSQPLFRSLFAAFSSIQNDAERLRRAYLSAQAMCVAALLPVGLGLSAVAVPFISLCLGDKWRDTGTVVAFCGVTIAMMTLTGPSQAFSLAIGRTRTLFERDTLALILRIPCLLIGIIAYQMTGLLISLLVSTALLVGITAHMMSGFIGVSVVGQIANCGRSIVSGVIMYAVAASISGIAPLEGPFLIRAVMLGVVVGTGAAVYAAAHGLLWLVAGRPDGPEVKLLGALAKARMRLAGAAR